MNKIVRSIVAFFKMIYRGLDRFIVTPISRFIYHVGDRLKNNPSHIEKFLNRPHILFSGFSSDYFGGK